MINANLITINVGGVEVKLVDALNDLYTSVNVGGFRVPTLFQLDSQLPALDTTFRSKDDFLALLPTLKNTGFASNETVIWMSGATPQSFFVNQGAQDFVIPPGSPAGFIDGITSVASVYIEGLRVILDSENRPNANAAATLYSYYDPAEGADGTVYNFIVLKDDGPIECIKQLVLGITFFGALSSEIADWVAESGCPVPAGGNAGV